MKLVFLDMDGVLNSHQSSHYFWWKKHNRKTFMNSWDQLCPIACSNLSELLEKDPEIKVVISSTWRRFHELPEWDLNMADKCPAIVGRIIGKTPRLFRTISESAPRGWEIHNWLVTNGHVSTPFVVLDDDRDMDKVESKFIHIDGHLGLTYHDVRRAWFILGLEELHGG